MKSLKPYHLDQNPVDSENKRDLRGHLRGFKLKTNIQKTVGHT